MTIDPTQVPDPEIKPSSTPDGPQTIPTPNNPPHENPLGEPEPEPEEKVHFDNRASNPNSSGDEGLTGDMGVSSERTGPAGEDPAVAGVQGTGSRGTAVGQTDGTFDTSPTEWDAVDVSQKRMQVDPQVDGPSDFAYDDENVDRTVGEPRPEPIVGEKNRRDA